VSNIKTIIISITLIILQSNYAFSQPQLGGQKMGNYGNRNPPQVSYADSISAQAVPVNELFSPYAAFGEVLFVQGTIVDSFDLPISGAIVEIWQTNSAGKYQTLLDSKSDLVDKNFNMSGRATTDNLGNYFFITIVPGFYLNRSPHINFNIYHEKFGKLGTEMYFENHPRNQLDYQYLSYDQEDRDLLTATVRLTNIFNSKSTKIATFNIIMQGVHQYKNFGNN
jgi:protocatechuate 3,4-dioxygenase beta subunit